MTRTYARAFALSLNTAADRWDACSARLRSGHPGRVWLEDRHGPQRRLVIDGELPAAQAVVAGAGPLSSSALVRELEAGRWPEGEYAVVVPDPATGCLRLYRDPMARQPLFFHRSGAMLVVATTVAAVAAAAPHLDPDEHCIAEWLTMAPPDPRATLFAGVRRVRSGTRTTLDADGRRYRETATWQPTAVDTAEPAASMRALVRTAVRDSIDRPAATGVELSGGFDSATVAGLAASAGAPTAHTMSFPGLACDETTEARDAAARLGLEHRTSGARPLELDERLLLARVVGVMDMVPGQRRLLRAAAADGVEVVLSGDYGDELLASRLRGPADLLAQGHLVRLRRERSASGLSRADVLRHAFRDRYRAALPPAVRARRTTLIAACLGPALSGGSLARRVTRRERQWAPGLPSHRALRDIISTYYQSGLDHGCADVVPFPRVHRPLGSPALASLALAIPDWQKGDAADHRRLHRAALGDCLPERLRVGNPPKAEFSPSIHQHLEASPIVLDGGSLIARWGWIDVPAMQAMEGRRRADRDAGRPSEAMWICSYADALEVWARAWFT